MPVVLLSRFWGVPTDLSVCIGVAGGHLLSTSCLHQEERFKVQDGNVKQIVTWETELKMSIG